MSTVLFTREIVESIVQIAFELNRMNNLKEKELELKYKEELNE